VHHEPPDEVCDELELEVGLDFGAVRPDFLDLVEVPEVEVPDLVVVPPLLPLLTPLAWLVLV
jgi:hypothetical protein